VKVISITTAVICTLCNINSYAATVNVPQGASIQAAVNANPPGTVLQLSPGLYRQQTVDAKDGDQIVGALGGNGERLTTLSGAQLLTSFTRDGFGNYVATTNQTQPGQRTGECLSGYSRCTYPEDLFYDNQPYLHSAVGGAALAPGQYFFDYPSGRIYFKPRNGGDDPAQHTVEYSRNAIAVRGQYSPNVTVKNLIIEKYATPNQFGAVGDQYPATGWTVQNNEIRWNHGGGLRMSTDGRAIDNYMHDNGTMGVVGSGRNLLVQGNEIARNATYIGTYCEFECGGLKFTNTDGLVVRGNYSHDNYGPGMWTDLDNIRTLYEGNTVVDNTGPGIFHEISYQAVIRNNIIKHNKRPNDDWFWNAQIMISTSRDVEAYGNTIEIDSESSSNGIMLIQQDRTNDPCSYGECVVVNSYIHDNDITITGNRRHGSNGGAQDTTRYSDMYAPSSNNKFDRNHYHVTNANRDGYWWWLSNYQFWPWLKPLSQEVNGSVDSNFTTVDAAPPAPTPAPPAPAAAMQVGARVATTNGATIGSQLAGSQGTIAAGPVSAPGSPIWWFVSFDAGMNGWVSQDSLRLF
jgi:parallel beta-helix repeat protein